MPRQHAGRHGFALPAGPRPDRVLSTGDEPVASGWMASPTMTRMAITRTADDFTLFTSGDTTSGTASTRRTPDLKAGCSRSTLQACFRDTPRDNVRRSPIISANERMSSAAEATHDDEEALGRARYGGPEWCHVVTRRRRVPRARRSWPDTQEMVISRVQGSSPASDLTNLPTPGDLRRDRGAQTFQPVGLREERTGGHRVGQGAVLGHAGGQRQEDRLRHLPLPRQARTPVEPAQPGTQSRPQRGPLLHGGPQPPARGGGLPVDAAAHPRRARCVGPGDGQQQTWSPPRACPAQAKLDPQGFSLGLVSAPCRASQRRRSSTRSSTTASSGMGARRMSSAG